jgi:hypothetical protein
VSATRRSATSKISASAWSSVSSTFSSLAYAISWMSPAVAMRRRSIASSETICA